MKNILIALLLFCNVAVAQVQRLAILPTLGSVKISKGDVGSLATFCIDELADPPSYRDVYNLVHKGGDVSLKVNGKPFTGGLKAAIEGPNPILKLHANWYDQLNVEINSKRTDIKSIELKVNKPSVVGPRGSNNRGINVDIIFNNYPDVFRTADNDEYWRKHSQIEKHKKRVPNSNSQQGLSVAEKKAIDNEDRLVRQMDDLRNKYESWIIQELQQNDRLKFKNDGSLDQPSIDDMAVLSKYASAYEKIVPSYSSNSFFSNEELSKTRYFQSRNGLQQSGILDDATLDKLKVYTNLINNHFNDYGGPLKENLIFSGYTDEPKYCFKDDKGYYIIDFDGVWNRRELLSKDIDDLEKLHSEIIQDYSIFSTTKSKLIGIGSRDNNTLKAGIFTGDDIFETNWSSSDNYDELFSGALGDIIKNTSDDTPIIFSRDAIQASPIGVSDELGSKWLTEKLIGDRSWVNLTELTKEAKTRYPSKKFYLTTQARGLSKLSNVPKIKGSSDIAAYVAPKNEGVDYDLIRQMRKTLEDNKVNVYQMDDNYNLINQKVNEANIILLSGHKNENFTNYLKKLADNGLLEGKVVGVFSCNERGTANLNSYLINEGRARSVLFFDERISVPATKAFLKEMTQLLPKITDINADGMVLDDLIRSTIKGALNNPDYVGLQSELMSLQQSLLQQLAINTEPTTEYGRS